MEQVESDQKLLLDTNENADEMLLGTETVNEKKEKNKNYKEHLLVEETEIK